MKGKKKLLLSIFIIFSLLVPTINFQAEITFGKNQEMKDSYEMKFDSFNATSPWEFFNETKHPRYPLVARPFGILQYPHKGYPVIAEFDEEFNVVVNATETASGWIITIISQNDTIGLNILKSVYKENMWVHTVLPSEQIVGLYDLQLNCSTGDDYQTHAVKIVEEKTYPFNFVHISDTHFPAYWTEYNTTDINLEEFKKIKALNPDFVIITGDFIQGPSWYFVNPVNGRPMNAEPQLKLALWATDLLDLPVYLIHGNHDYSDSTLMTDRPEDVWKKYMGHIRYQNFSYLDWSFIGYGSYFDGLTEEEMTIVENILADQSEGADVLYYHYNFASQAKSLIAHNPIEVALYGHAHHEDLFKSKGTLYHCQEPLYHKVFTEFSVINETALTVKNQTFDFTGFSLPTTPTPTPTDTSSFSSLLVIAISLLTTFFIIRKRKKK